MKCNHPRPGFELESPCPLHHGHLVCNACCIRKKKKKEVESDFYFSQNFDEFMGENLRYFLLSDLPSCGCVNTTIWMHHTDANKTHWEKSNWLFWTNPKGDPHKTTAVWPLIFHLTNYSIQSGGVLIVQWLKRWTAESFSASSNSSRTITFTFGKIPVGKVWTPLSFQLWVKYYHCWSSGRMDLALNNPRRCICH